MMNLSIFRPICWTIAVSVLALTQGRAAAIMNKTLRVEHGRPIVLASQKSVLWLEFVKEPIADVMVPHEEANVRHCRARYRFRLFNGDTASVTNGEGVVEEIYQTILITATGREVKDVGSRVGISAGEFYLWWSEGSAGTRSWIYYRTDSPIRFIQQPGPIPFEGVDADQFRRYLASRNVQEFVEAGKSVRVLGPAVFAGDLPTDAPTSARIESGRVADGTFRLTLSNLATNRNYIIESSFEVKGGNWTPIHTFIAGEVTHEWSDPLSKDVEVTFYRIREGAY
jgi:hypothetical protein